MAKTTKPDCPKCNAFFIRNVKQEMFVSVARWQGGKVANHKLFAKSIVVIYT